MHIYSRVLYTILVILTTTSFLSAQRIVWQKTLGGSGYDNGMKMQVAKDGSYFLGGTTESTDGLGEGNHSTDADFLIMKITPTGNVIWSKVLGGSGREEFGDMKVTPDNGVIVIGTTFSYNGDVKLNNGKRDIWVVKLDAMGTIDWARCYGSRSNDAGLAVEPLSDGGYLIGGEAGSNTGEVKWTKGALDAWAVKLDKNGEIVWQRVLGGLGNDRITDIMEFPGNPSKYLLMGSSTSPDLAEARGNKDAYAVMLSKNGDVIWEHNYGGSGNDEVHSIYRNKQGEIICAGTTFSEDEDIDESYGMGDFWLFLITDEGNLGWSTTYGGSKSDGANGVTQTDDGGYLVVGTSNSSNLMVRGNHGLYDGWVVKTDSVGNMQWTKNFGGKDFEYLYDVMQMPNGEFMALGFAESIDFDLASTGKLPGNDFWLFRFIDPNMQATGNYKTTYYVTGYVKNKITGDPVEASVILTDNEKLEEVAMIKSHGNNGTYILELPNPKGDYSINFSTPGYMLEGTTLDLTGIMETTQVRQDALMVPIREGGKYILHNTYFDSGSFQLREESTPELKRLAHFMEINPTVQIEISGHTDNTGNVATKKELSQKRAEAVRNMLLKLGVPGHRMTVMGYGLEKPIADNNTEEGRQANRRVEIEIKQK